MYPDGEHEYLELEEEDWQRRAEEDADAALMEMWREAEEDAAPECPFCRHPVDVLADGRHVCGNCEVTWSDADELAADDVEPSDEDWYAEINAGYMRDCGMGNFR